MKQTIVLLCLLLILQAHSQSPFPLKISENKRYFITQQNKPFLYTAETGWQIFARLTTEEAVEYMAFRKAQGFNTIQVQVSMNPDSVNRYDHKPFLGDVDFSRPDEAYHDHVATILHKADSLGLLMVMSQPWLGCCAEGFGGPGKPISKNGPGKLRQYGQYLGKKFSAFKNLFWFAGGDNDPKGDRESIVAFAEGLYAAAPKHQLIAYHGSPPHSSTDLFQYAPWLGFSFIYTYWREKPNAWVVPDLQPHVYEAALREWSKSDRMPFVLGESQYEGTGKIENDMGTAHIVRRQAYWTVLCGGAGHAYGSDIWGFPGNWREIMRYPGAYQMGYAKTFFETLPWQTLVPDVRHQAVVAGYGRWSGPDYVTTAVSEDKKLLVSYLPTLLPVTINFGYLSGNTFTCTWFNPANGQYEKRFTVKEKTVRQLYPPTGEDWVLTISGM